MTKIFIWYLILVILLVALFVFSPKAHAFDSTSWVIGQSTGRNACVADNVSRFRQAQVGCKVVTVWEDRYNHLEFFCYQWK